MASIVNLKGRKRLDFTFGERPGKRHSIYLGRMADRDAQRIKLKVEALVSAKVAGQPPDKETAEWVAGLDAKPAAKLAAVGLIAARANPAKRAAATLGPFLETYIAERCDVKGGTATFYGHTKRNLIGYFGADKPLADITAGDADAFRLWLIGNEGLSDNTVRRRCGMAKQFFRAAARRKLIAENPFGDLKGTQVRSNRKRDYFISRDEAEAVIAACPDAQWRLIFALSRYGGLRCPSEHLLLRWGDIDWERNRMTVHSPKTEHHEGGALRVIPLFPELRSHLEAVWDEAPEGTEFVITRYRDTNANLRTRLRKIIKRAGLKPWPKLFHNLRASRQTELAASFPMHVVCEWIGNSTLIAQEHYLRVTEGDFEAASAQQNAQQQGPESPGNASQELNSGNAETPENPAFQDFQGCTGVGGTGLEFRGKRREKRSF